jgi:hypothetical protein
MTDQEVISLRVYIETLLAAERERVNTVLKGNSEALRLQHEEYLRRLRDLNGEANRLRTIQETYVPRETYEGYIKEQANAAKSLVERVDASKEALEKASSETRTRIESRIKELSQELAEGRGNRAGIEDAQGRFLAIAAGLVAFAALVINFLH